ncbi:MAG: tetratricopeptide repeat protein, partial [Myxococcota bacterium]|nr:tetratricopeptide repeat protein [Myxococcota bacterium]
ARRAYIDASLRLSMHEDVGEELLALLHDAGQESERIAWVRLFESEWASSSDHSERAIQGFNEALQRFSATDNDYACTRALLGLGIAKTRSGQLSAGITLLEQAETLARANANHNLLADALLAKAQALFDSGEQRRALQALDEALVLYQRQANTSGVGDTHMRLARCYLSLNQLELAQTHFESARAAYNLVGDRARLVRILTGLGELARARRAFERAELLYAQALELLAGRERDESAWVLQANLGLVQLQRGTLDEARQSLALARDEFARLGSHLYEAIVLGLLASLECAKGDFDAAHRWLTANELLALEKAPADRDYAFTLKDAAEKAFRHDQVPLASRMLKLSLQSLRLLSEHQAAEAVQRRIEQFAEIQKRTSP